MKKLLVLPLLLSALLLAGCSSPSSSTSKSASSATRVDHGPLQAKTFNFVNGGIAMSPPATDPLLLTQQLIQASIIKDLSAKGLTLTTGTGDVIVAYLTIVGSNAGTESVDTFFGSDRGADALLEKADAANKSNSNPNKYRNGALLIDVIDAKSFTLLYRDYTVRPISENATTDERAAVVQGAVDAALAKLQVAP